MSAAEPVARSSTGVISGIVTNKTTGNGLMGAKVEIPRLNVSVLVDNTGRYVVNVPPGNHEVVVSYTGLDSQSATVSASPTPGKICYNSGGFPNRNATMTDADGIAYVLNIGPGDAMVTASKSGLTYRMQKVTARAGVFTTTPIQP